MTEIIRYAYSKGIKVIPMFDIPGHMNAVIAAMKELDIGVCMSGVELTLHMIMV